VLFCAWPITVQNGRLLAKAQNAILACKIKAIARVREKINAFLRFNVQRSTCNVQRYYCSMNAHFKAA